MAQKDLYYFAYGNNMSTAHMKRREVHIKNSEIGRIPGWRLAFSRYSREWRGGVLDLIPGEEDDWVEGVIYTVDPSDLATLDGYEGRAVKRNMEIGLYRRVYLPVNTESGWKTVVTYLINRSVEYRENTYFPPSKRYMKLILEGAEEHGLSKEYIEKLNTWSEGKRK